jgi:hypothetical protein
MFTAWAWPYENWKVVFKEMHKTKTRSLEIRIELAASQRAPGDFKPWSPQPLTARKLMI